MRTLKTAWPYTFVIFVLAFVVPGWCYDWSQEILAHRQSVNSELQRDDPENAVLRLESDLATLQIDRTEAVSRYKDAVKDYTMSPNKFTQSQMQDHLAYVRLHDTEIADTKQVLAKLKGRLQGEPAAKPSNNKLPKNVSKMVEDDASIGEQPDNSRRKIGPPGRSERNDDTRITSDGRINAANASDQLATTSGLPCTEYVAKVVAASGIDVNERLPGRSFTIKDAINMNEKVLAGASVDQEYLNLQIKLDGRGKGEQRTKGVVYALTAADKGVEIDLTSGVSALQRGDLVQYWYLEGDMRRGHAAVVVEPMGDDGKVTLRGSQKGVEGEFRTTLHYAHFKYAVRPNRYSKGLFPVASQSPTMLAKARGSSRCWGRWVTRRANNLDC